MTDNLVVQQEIPIDFLTLPESDQNDIERAYESGQHVYFVYSGDHNSVKIGVANNPILRLSTMQTGSPTKLELLHVIPHGGYWLESRLHHKFGQYRKQGEWFEFAPAISHIISKSKKLQEQIGITWNPKTQKVTV